MLFRKLLLLLCFFISLSALLSCKGRLYTVPSSSMEGTIPMGKSFYMDKANRFERNDIVVYDYFGPDYGKPNGESGTYAMGWSQRVSRLIAVSGDIIQIKDGEVFLNQRPIAFPPLAKMPYTISSQTAIKELQERGDFLVPPTTTEGVFVYTTVLTIKEAEEFEQRRPQVISIKRYQDLSLRNDSLARTGNSDVWTVDNYGPMPIPSLGDKVTVNAGNYKLFHNIPGIKMGVNLIDEKLYFLMGDNRHGAEDSRYIGFITHSKMIGIVK